MRPCPERSSPVRRAATAVPLFAELLVAALAILLVLPSAMAAQSSPTDGKPENAGDGSDQTPVSAVLELFTSQGCSSCPPADALFKSYVDRKDVVALSLPVDYWDYLGWKDTLASSKNSDRQRAYAKARGDGAVYTPQVVVNGSGHAVGSDAAAIERQIARTTMDFDHRRVAMRFWRASNVLIVEAAAANPADPDRPNGARGNEATLWLAAVQREAEVTIPKGENHGKTLKYYNVVEEMTPIGLWNGEAMRLQLPSQTFIKPGTYRYAVIMQQGTTGPIIGAAWMGW
ncbi:MAG: DUF1223 domain-containing protein [Hyphomicrobiaceae bacterium]|nr:DUF1223 domain-containing protein [Hyphomicrobiaceae bacterium]